MLNNKTHPITLLVLSIFYLIAIFLATKQSQYLIIVIATFINLQLIVKKIHYRAIIIFIISLIPVGLAMFISGYLFANNPLNRLDIASILTIRLLALSLVSFMFSIHIQYQEIIYYLMQKKILSIKVGYSLLAIFNAFSYFPQEFYRIQLAHKIRHHKYFISPKILITLLVVAARYAHNLSISLYTRGLNSKKTFIHKSQYLTTKDYLIYIVNIVIIWLILSFLRVCLIVRQY